MCLSYAGDLLIYVFSKLEPLGVRPPRLVSINLTY